MFNPGDRVFSHYTMSWGTVLDNAGKNDAVSGTWYNVQFDRGSKDLMNDADGNWELARIVPPEVAVRYGYPADTAIDPGVKKNIDTRIGEIRDEISRLAETGSTFECDVRHGWISTLERATSILDHIDPETGY